MPTPLTSLALCCALLPSFQAETTTEVTARGLTDVQVQKVMGLHMKEHLGFTIYRPTELGAGDLVRFASELTDDHVTYYEVDDSGRLKSRVRDRFVIMGDAIGVQDFREQRDEAIVLFQRLEAELAPERDPKPAPDDGMVQATIELQRMNSNAAHNLIRSSWPLLQTGSSLESSFMTVRGRKEEVAAAQALLEKADRPLPQVLLQWSLLEAVDPGSAPKTDEGRGLAHADIARALAPFAPGKEFRQSGSFMVRGAAGGGSLMRVSSMVHTLNGTSSTLPGEVSLTANAQGFDANTGRLYLKQCEIVIQRQHIEMTPNGAVPKTSTDNLTTDLAILEGETTVIGSLGGDSVFIALKFTVLP